MREQRLPAEAGGKSGEAKKWLCTSYSPGTVWVNTYRTVSFLSPFGGYKRSGLGRESGQEMIKEYMQGKSVWLAITSETPNPFILR